MTFLSDFKRTSRGRWMAGVLLATFVSFPFLARCTAAPREVASVAPVDTVIAPAPLPAEPDADLPAEVRTLLAQGRNWRAARAMREHLPPDASPQTVLAAARAEAGWGGWSNARDLLEGKSWLDATGLGEGWFLLGRAREEDREWAAATEAYGRFLQVAPPGEEREVAELRRGLALLRSGEVAAGTEALDRARASAPEVAEWTGLLMAEALAERGDTARIRRLLEDGIEGASPLRAQRAYVRAHREAGDPAGARRLALHFRARAGSDAARAEFRLHAARAALALGDRAAARGDALAVVRGAPGSGSAPEAASLLRELGEMSRADRLAIARVYDRHGNHERAVTGYREWLASDAGTAAERREVRLRLGRALFDAGRYEEAEAALRPLFEAPATVAAEATYLAGRAQYRSGSRVRAQETFLRAAERFPGASAAADALFLVADLSHDAGETDRARGLYRRVADEFPGHDRAGLSLMRLGGMAFGERDFTGAAEVWERYRTQYPRGERWPQATYWAGRAYREAGDEARAAARFREVRAREPLSYYALRGAERLGEPFWPIPLRPAPAEDAAAERRVEGWMRPVDVLRDAGLFGEAETEAERIVRRAGDDPTLLYPLAEALNRRGYTVQGVGIGYRLRDLKGGYDARILRILYPFPYRSLIAAEAEEKGLDPFLVAALTRQESTFKARISSPVGARGLMQIMPETGRQLSYGAEIRGWDPELLFNPEINVHLGTRYLADQMRTYDGSLPSVFSAYNAGPHRVERWKEFPEYGDEELFTERIPYAETRDYVKILTRNIALYRALYAQNTGGAQTLKAP